MLNPIKKVDREPTLFFSPERCTRNDYLSIYIYCLNPVKRTFGQVIMNDYLAVFKRGCLVPISFLIWIATFASSSLSKQRRLIKEVGYPTIFSASDTALFHSDALVELHIAKFRCKCLLTADVWPYSARKRLNIAFWCIFLALANNECVKSHHLMRTKGKSHYCLWIVLKSDKKCQEASILDT